MFNLSSLPRHLPAALRDAGAAKVEVRRSAVRDLARHGDGDARAEVIARLLVVLADDAAPEVRGEAAVALADVGAAEAVPGLMDATEDVQLRVRQLALMALGEVSEPGDAAVDARLRAAMSGDSAALRYQALIALSHRRAEDALELLVAATRDADASVRHVAVRLLEERVSADGAGVGERSVELPASVAARARALLRDDAPRVRLAAAILLGRAGDRAGRESLVAAVEAASGALEPEDEQAAVELAGALGLEDARRGLGRRAFGWLGVTTDPAAFQARVALARMGDARAEAAILRALRSRNRDTRTVAVVAAGRARLTAARPLIADMCGDPGRAEPSAVAEALARLDAPPA